METPGGRKDHGAGIPDPGGPKGENGPGRGSARSGDDFGASRVDAGIDAWGSALNLMSWGQNQVERMTRVWFDRTPVSAERAASTSPGAAIEQRQVQVGEFATHYLTAGEGPPLVLLHGHGESSGSWRWAMPALARTRRCQLGCGGHDTQAGVEYFWHDNVLHPMLQRFPLPPRNHLSRRLAVFPVLPELP